LNGMQIKEVEIFKSMPLEKQIVVLFKNVVEVKDDVKKLKARKWLNTGASATGGIVGGFVAMLLKTAFWK